MCGRKTANRVQLSIFDKAVNEYTPFKENMPHTMLRYCWYHRGLQKTKPIRRKVDNDATRQVLGNFDLLCGYVSNEVETEKEYIMLMNLIAICIKLKYQQGFISETELAELNNQLSCINRNKSHISNHFFIRIRHMQKRTATANEVRHHNYKYGKDRIKPNFNIAESSKKMSIKRAIQLIKRN